MYKVICESCLRLLGVKSTAEPHTDKTLDKTPANICRKLETKFLSQCYVQLEERVMFPRVNPDQQFAFSLPPSSAPTGAFLPFSVPAPGAAPPPWWRTRCGSVAALPSPQRFSGSGFSCCHTPLRWKTAPGQGSHPCGTGRDEVTALPQSPRGKQHKARENSSGPLQGEKHPSSSSAARQHVLNF